MLEIIPVEDCIYGIGDTQHGHKRYNKIDYKYNRKDQIKRCFICGTKDPNRGCCWVEYYNGDGCRNVRHFLCKTCRDAITGMIWLDK